MLRVLDPLPGCPPTPSGWGGGPFGHPCGLSGMLWGWGDYCTDFYVAGSPCFHLPAWEELRKRRE